MDRATRMLVRAAAKLLIEAHNHGTLTEPEQKRVIAAYKRLIIALNAKKDTP